MSTVNVSLLSGSGELAGGSEYSPLDLVSALGESRFRPHVVCPGPGTLWEHLRVMGIPGEILPFPEWRSIRLIAIARAPAGLVGRWRRMPVIWYVRVKESEEWKKRLLALLVTRIVANSDAVVTPLEDAPHAHRRGMACRRRAETLFSLSRHVEAVETLY